MAKNLPKKQEGAAVILMDADERILMLQRSPSKSHPLKWGFPGGKIEKGETPPKAASRELLEETRLRRKSRVLTAIAESVSPTGRNFHYFASQEPALPGEMQIRLNDEHTGYGWFPLDALAGLDHIIPEAIMTELYWLTKRG